MQITRVDVLWNYAATFMKVAASVLLLPFILKMMPPETVGIWTVLITISAFTSLLDFGFSSSFARNITYIFSGVKTLKTNGFETIGKQDNTVDIDLLKGVISAMRWFYSGMAVILFFILLIPGTFYIYFLMQDYNGKPGEVYIAWALLCAVSTYGLYTLYYESLLQGKGLIKRSKQIIIIGQSAYVIIAAILIMAGNGLVAIISAQAVSVIIIRWLSYQSFFTEEMRHNLDKAQSSSRKEIIGAIYPNAIKIGLTTMGAFLVQRSAVIIGSLYIPLQDIASYGVTFQIISLIAGLGLIYTNTYLPKIAQLRVLQNNQAIKVLYLKGLIVLLLTFFSGGLAAIFFGERALDLLKSQTILLPQLMIMVFLVTALLESNHSMAGLIILSKNEVPFFKAAILSGIVTVLLLLFFFQCTRVGLWAMIIAPGLAQALYQNWRWPMVVAKELHISINDIPMAFVRFFKNRY